MFSKMLAYIALQWCPMSAKADQTTDNSSVCYNIFTLTAKKALWVKLLHFVWAGGFPAQRASTVDSISMSWNHHGPHSNQWQGNPPITVPFTASHSWCCYWRVTGRDFSMSRHPWRLSCRDVWWSQWSYLQLLWKHYKSWYRWQFCSNYCA